MSPVVIAGGGLAGCLTALALTKRRPDVDFLLLEEAGSFGGNHTWSFFDSDVAKEHRWLLDGLTVRRWDDHEIRFPHRQRRIGLGYNSIRSPDLNNLVCSSIPAERLRTGAAVHNLDEKGVTLATGERITAAAVLDARGPEAVPGLELGWQKFVGRMYLYPRGHGCTRPMIMDAQVDQSDGFRFVYLLPFSDTELLVEDTYYSTSPDLDVPRLGELVDAYAQSLGPDKPVQVDEETGVLPVVIRGSAAAFWPEGGSVPRLGLRGGFFHPTTGYSLPDAIANAVLIAQQEQFSTSRLYRLLRDRAERVWSERRFFQLLNRMLLHAADPAERYRVLEHFYRLPVGVIARFYAAQLTPFDKLRILSGRPPVPIGRALGAMRRKAA